MRGGVELQQHPVDERDEGAVELPQIGVFAWVRERGCRMAQPAQAQPVQGVVELGRFCFREPSTPARDGAEARTAAASSVSSSVQATRARAAYAESGSPSPRTQSSIARKRVRTATEPIECLEAGPQAAGALRVPARGH